MKSQNERKEIKSCFFLIHVCEFVWRRQANPWVLCH